MATLTSNERLTHLGDESEQLKGVVLRAVDELNRSDHVPEEITKRLGDQLARVPDQLSAADFDKDALHTAWHALWEMKRLLDAAEPDVDLDTLDKLLIAVEQFRHVIRDALDEYVPQSDQTAALVAQVRAWLPGIPKTELAELLGIDVRTFARWEKRLGPPTHRLAVVTKLVAVLRHSWTPEGVVAWFKRANCDLGGKRPLRLLDQPTDSPVLLAAARSTRSMYGT